jgi:6-phosphogluconolactonase/glucosamine-6-phosphate isomerase/deaminase
MKSNTSVKIFKNLDELSEAVKISFLEIAKQSILERGSFFVAVSGGSTPMTL